MIPTRCFFKFLTVLTFAAFGGQERAFSAPVVILKLDDLKASSTSITGFSTPWDRLFNYSATKPLVMSVGIIGNSLETTNPAYAASIRQIHDAGRVEFWNHGYLHVRDQPVGTFEFKGTTYAYQLSNFQTTQSLARERLGFPFTTFGSPYNATDDVTRQVLETDLDMQTSLFGPSTSSRLLDLKRWLNMEVSAGVMMDYDTFVANYPSQRQRPYLVLQGHPSGWDEAEFTTFTRIVDFLIADGVTFMTPSGYRANMDSDMDGVPDVIERILGRNPALPESAPPIALDLPGESLGFELAATQPARPRLAVEFSTDQNTWMKTTVSPGFITTLPDGRRRIEIPVSLAPQRMFWRLAEGPGGSSTWP